MPTNQTENYRLSQWERTDQVQMEDFNADNLKIDGALKANADALAAHGEALAKLDNGRVHIGSYVGTGQCGQEHPTRYTFPAVPACFLVLRGGGDYHMIARGGSTLAGVINGTTVALRWDGSTALWFNSSAAGQFNAKDAVYLVVAFYEI